MNPTPEQLESAWFENCRADEVLGRQDMPVAIPEFLAAVIDRSQAEPATPEVNLRNHASGFGSAGWRTSPLVLMQQLGLLVEAVVSFGVYDEQALRRVHTIVTARASDASVTAWREQAETDSLTRLANRRRFDEEVSELARAFSQSVIVVSVDLDGLKRVNDTEGHDAGDRLIRAFADILRGVANRLLAQGFRFGGDEFALLVTGSSLAAVRSELVAVQAEGRVSFSFGAEEATDASEVMDLWSQADRAMYEDKKNRK